MRITWVGFGAVLVGAGCVVLAAPGQVRAQAVAFQPNIGMIPDGLALTAVPVVSADRRYVRVSVNASFQTVNGFQNIGIPFAVSGLGGGGNAGVGLPGGGGGGGPTGLRSVGVAMGMDGPVAGGPAGFAGNGPAEWGSVNSAAWDDGSWTPGPRRTKSSRSKAATAARPKKATAAPSTPSRPAATPSAASKGR